MTNIELLTATLDYIETNPATWNQQHYRHQGTLCFAARAATLAGYRWKRPNAIADPYMVDDDGREIHCRTIAKRELGLDQLDATRLFDGGNTLARLRELVQQHVELSAYSEAIRSW